MTTLTTLSDFNESATDLSAPVDVLAMIEREFETAEAARRGHCMAVDPPTVKSYAMESRETLVAVRDLIEVASATFPRNLCATNPNVADSTKIPLTATYGELRKLHAALARCKGQSA